MKKRLLAFITAVLFIIPLALFAAAPSGTLKISKSGSKKGAVSFNHVKHSKDCKSCHHKGLDSGKCMGCHKGADAKKQMHKNCVGCHKKQSGPTKCKACH